MFIDGRVSTTEGCEVGEVGGVAIVDEAVADDVIVTVDGVIDAVDDVIDATDDVIDATGSVGSDDVTGAADVVTVTEGSCLMCGVMTTLEVERAKLMRVCAVNVGFFGLVTFAISF